MTQRLRDFAQIFINNKYLLIAGMLLSAWRLFSMEIYSHEPALSLLNIGYPALLEPLFSNFTLSALCAVIVSLVLLLLAYKKRDIVNSMPLYVIGFSFAGLSVFADTFAGYLNSDIVSLISAALMGLSDGIVYPLFILNLLQKSPREIIALLAGSAILSYLLYPIMTIILTTSGQAICELGFILVAAVLLKRNAGKIHASYEELPSTQTLISGSNIPFLGICVFVLCFALTRGSVQSYALIGPGTFNTVIISTLLSHVLLLGFCFFSEVRSLISLLSVTIAIMIVGVATLPLYSAGIHWASFAYHLGYSAFVVLRWAFIPFLRSDRGAQFDVWIVLTMMLLNHLGKFLGSGAVTIFHAGSSELFATILSVALLCVIILSVLIVFLSLQPFLRQRSRESSERTIDSPEAASTREACRRLSVCYELTERESEILYLISTGKSASRVEKELYISKNTVKTHIKHIYSKIGAHTRDELLEMIDEQKSHDTLV